MQPKIQLIGQEHRYYEPPKEFTNLEELIIFPDAELKPRDKHHIPNSSVWTFSREGHTYNPEILHNDVGCGMALALTDPIPDIKGATDKIYQALKGENILGRGNHFVDIMEGEDNFWMGYSAILLHTDAKHLDLSIPTTVEEAVAKQQKAKQEREKIIEGLTASIGVTLDLIYDYPHNTIEEQEETVIYRKGSIVVTENKPHPLPSSVLGNVLFYTGSELNPPPQHSMPHATGRNGPKGETKVTEEQAEKIREQVYIPNGIRATSLRTEHPSCYHTTQAIYDLLGQHIISLGETKILGYVGKV